MNATSSASQSPSASSPEWFSPTEAAKAVDVGKRTVYRAIASGDLRASKVNGRDFRIASAWLWEWMLRRSAR